MAWAQELDGVAADSSDILSGPTLTARQLSSDMSIRAPEIDTSSRHVDRIDMLSEPVKFPVLDHHGFRSPRPPPDILVAACSLTLQSMDLPRVQSTLIRRDVPVDLQPLGHCH